MFYNNYNWLKFQLFKYIFINTIDLFYTYFSNSLLLINIKDSYLPSFSNQNINILISSIFIVFINFKLNFYCFFDSYTLLKDDELHLLPIFNG